MNAQSSAIPRSFPVRTRNHVFHSVVNQRAMELSSQARKEAQ
jgi:hypothetical protein